MASPFRITATSLREKVCERIEKAFSGHINSGAHQTVLSQVGFALDPFPGELDSEMLKLVFNNLKQTLAQIHQGVFRNQGIWLDKAPYDATITAVRDVEKEFFREIGAPSTLTPLQVKGEVEKALIASFVLNNGSFKTATKAAGEICDKALESADSQQILAQIERRFGELRDAEPKTGVPHLRKEAYGLAINALRNVQQSLGLPTQAVDRRDASESEQKGRASPPRASNAKVFEETLAMVEKGEPPIDQASYRMLVGNIKYYSPEEVEPIPPRDKRPKGYVTHFSVVNQSTLKVTEEEMLQDPYSRPLVLIMANGTEVMGKPKSANTQEECIARQSTLYPALVTKLAKKDRRKYDRPLGNGVIYSTPVEVFREGPEEGYKVRRETFMCSTCSSASYDSNPRHGAGYDRPGSDKEYEEGMKEKMRVNFRVAYHNLHPTLTLGALGCGAFTNKPEEVAKFYRDVFSEDEFRGVFKTVTFAILDKPVPGQKTNFDIFKEVFEGSRPNEEKK